ncbi:MAG: aminotransferase class IV [Flavisolibacter sp.]
MALICYNGEFFPAEQPLLGVQNRAFKYGDGVFETIKVKSGAIELPALHRERLGLSLKLFGFAGNADIDRWMELALACCEQNNCLSSARVRLQVFRQEDDDPGFAIEVWPLAADAGYWYEKGLQVDLFGHCRKSCDAYANLKTCNFLPYVLAARDAKEKKIDDCLVLNQHGFICDSSKANVFFIIGEKIMTPALHQGCVNGVMRRHVIDTLKRFGIPVYQEEVREEDLLKADEMFLTNAIIGIKWVELYKQKRFTHTRTKEIFNSIFNQQKD